MYIYVNALTAACYVAVCFVDSNNLGYNQLNASAHSKYCTKRREGDVPSTHARGSYSKLVVF